MVEKGRLIAQEIRRPTLGQVSEIGDDGGPAVPVDSGRGRFDVAHRTPGSTHRHLGRRSVVAVVVQAAQSALHLAQDVGRNEIRHSSTDQILAARHPHPPHRRGVREHDGAVLVDTDPVTGQIEQLPEALLNGRNALHRRPRGIGVVSLHIRPRRPDPSERG